MCLLPIPHTNLPTHFISLLLSPSPLPPRHQSKIEYIPIILPLLICLTAPGFNLPPLAIGVFAFLLYDSLENTPPLPDAEIGELSNFMGR